ncbi:methyltransferase domain-containing protein [candidate division WOR-3 bacterium]|nr:methyltransferase domain-containing protein [candidate division WOR-3 bacterium]
MEIGKYSMDNVVTYLRANPEFMDRVMRLYNDFDIQSLNLFFEEFDLTSPFKTGKLTHKRFIENKEAIFDLIKDPNAYPTPVKNKDYLGDDYTKKIYNNAATKYDDIWDSVWTYETRGGIIDFLNPAKNDKILEVGVGTGTNLKIYPDYCEITGIDYSEKMLEVCKQKVAEYPKKNISLQLMDAHKMSFDSDSFDRVLCFYALCSVRDPLTVLKEIQRVCKPNGRIVIFDIIKSEISEVAVLQYLFRPIAKEMGAIYVEFSPPYVISYDSFLDLFNLFENLSIKVDEVLYSDPYKTAVLLRYTNQK